PAGRGQRHHRDPGDARHRRGDPARRYGAGDDRAARSYRRRIHGDAAAPAQPRHRPRSGLCRPVRPHLRAPARGGHARDADRGRRLAAMAGRPATEPAPVPAPPPAAVRSLLADPRILGWGSIVVVLAAWEGLAWGSGVSPLYLPRPSQILVALVAMFGAG